MQQASEILRLGLYQAKHEFVYTCTPQYSWNTAKTSVKHQSSNQCMYMY
jgi:hypothetical protein